MIICYTVPDIWHVTDVITFFFYFGLFFALLSLNSPKTEKFKKMNKTSGDIIILHKCTKNHDLMLYCSWDMVCDKCNYFSVWAIFCPFTPITVRKMKISKKWKTAWFYFKQLYQNLWSYAIPFLRYNVRQM